MDENRKEFIGIFSLEKQIQLDFSKYEYYSLKLLFNKEKFTPYGTETKIYDDTIEVSSIALSSANGILGVNFFITRDKKLELRDGKVYIDGGYKLYKNIGEQWYFFTIILYGFKM